jgi:hypothetical protein
MPPQRHKSIICILAVALTFIVPACKDAVQGGSTLSDLQTVIPLKVGTSWTYLDIMPSSLPSFPDDSTLVDVEVQGYVDSGMVRVYELSGFIGEGESGMYYESVSRSKYRRYRENDDGHRVLIATILQTPIERGSRWFINDVDASGGYAEIGNPDTTIDIPSGRFSHVICVRGLTPEHNVWFIKPAVGIVYETRTGEVTVTRQLVEKNF